MRIMDVGCNGISSLSSLAAMEKWGNLDSGVDTVKGQEICQWRRRITLFLFLALLAHGGWTAYQILRSANLAAESEPTEVAIVLGAAVWRDQPSPVFAARIDYALELLESGSVGY